MRTDPAPLHLLFFREPLADDGIDGCLDEGRGNPLPGPVTFAVVDQACAVGSDVGSELADGGEKFAHDRVVRFERFRIKLQFVDFLTGTVRIAVPEMPFDPAEGFKDALSGLLTMVFDTLAELARDRDAYGDVEPVEDMFACRRDHLGKRADLFSSVGDEGDVLIGLNRLLFKMVKDTPQRLAIVAMHKTDVTGISVLR